MSTFTSSLSTWVDALSLNTVIMMIMMIFMIIGAVDKIRGNINGYGEKFEEGFHAIGPLALAMAGVIAAAPVLAQVLSPILVPLGHVLHCDPSIFACILLGTDTGGYPLAMALCEDHSVGMFAGMILGSMMGITIVFTIPVALGIIKQEDQRYLGAGVLAGMITIPIGCIAGGIMMNIVTPYKIAFGTILINLIPVIVIAALIVAGLWIAPTQMINGFNKFGKAVTALITVFTAIAVFEQITGIMFPLFYKMATPDEATGLTPLSDGLLVCGEIGIVLIGAFPMVEWVSRTFGNSLKKLGHTMNIREKSSAGFIATLANNIAMFHLLGEMDPKGKLINIAFAVTASFALGDHLGFVAGVDQQMVTPLIVSKLVGGICAIFVANLLAPKLLEKIQND